MVTIFGKKYSREDLLRRVGSLHQIVFARPFQFTDSVEKGVEGVHVHTGSGFSFVVLFDRGMDIGFAEYQGAPLAWISPTGYAAPSFFEPKGYGWLRGFYGGLLTTCGLTYAGAPCVDRGEELGLHGRASYTPASNHHVSYRWVGDDLFVDVNGEVREASVFGPNILLKRRITAKAGESKILIHDEVVNEGWDEQPFMMLYHFNVGFPVVDEGSKLVLTSTNYVPRDEEAWKEHESFDRFTAPVEGFREKVYFHDLATDPEGYAYAGIINQAFMGGRGIGVYLRYKKRQLHRFIEWKMMGEGTYVVGMEPANCLVLGRAKEREWGTLQYLKTGEKREIEIELGVLACAEEIESFAKKVSSITGGVKPMCMKSVEEFVKATSTSQL